MRVIVSGSRTWTDEDAVWGALDLLYEEVDSLTVVHGDCPTGADRMAKNWFRYRRAQGHDIGEEPHEAEWKVHRNHAGPIRNAKMASLGAAFCLAFLMPCTKATCPRRGVHGTHGTMDMVRQARRHGIEVILHARNIEVM